MSHRSAFAIALAALAATAPGAAATTVRDGNTRFQVITPTLVRVEYAADGRFENRPTQTVGRRSNPKVKVSSRVSKGWRVIRTSAMTLRYRRGSGPIAAANLQILREMDGKQAVLRPRPGDSPQNLGGWRRALDLSSGPVATHEGILSRAGWYLLDDTKTVLLDGGKPGFSVRTVRTGDYQDAFVFGYGHDYARGLRDLRALTGPTPMLPRQAFGVWLSRYWPYTQLDYPDLLGMFRTNHWPLDTLSVDTDFKRPGNPAGSLVAGAIAGAPLGPFAWNGWEFNDAAFPDPKGFFDWAHREGLSVSLNIHPSIGGSDPKWKAVQSETGGLETKLGMCQILQADVASCGVFDWTKPAQLDTYMALHQSFEDVGADFFWLDWCCDASHAVAPGLTADTWINAQYAARQRTRGQRWLPFSRIGGSFVEGAPNDNDGASGGNGIFAEHRYAVHFTGDTCATWPMLAFEAQISTGMGNAGMPYVSHDIGSFNGVPYNGQCGATGTALLTAHLPDDIYARWVQFGTFQPLDRLHSNHGDRFPTDYPGAAGDAAAEALRLREALNPYIYSLARRSHDTGLPMTGALALQWPQQPGAYNHPYEFTFGEDMVVAPVVSPGNPAPVTAWIPPGTWVDYFTGERFSGPREVRLSVPLSRIPVFVRAGAVIATQPYVDHTAPGVPALTILTAYPGRQGKASLYDDAGVGFAYERGESTRTAVAHRVDGRRTRVTIGESKGLYGGAPARRAWRVVLKDVAPPVSVEIGGARLKQASGDGRGFSYDAATRTLTVNTGAISTGRAAVITARR